MAESGADRAPETIAVVTLMLTLGGIFVFARTVTRTIIRPNFGWDDALIIITWVLNLAFSVALYTAVGLGYGKPMAEIPLERLPSTLRAVVVYEFFAVLNYPTGKASIAYLLLRIFPGRNLRWILWSFVAVNALLFYLNGVLVFAQCSPVQYGWNRSIPGGSCWRPGVMRNYGLITGIFGAVTDFVFATLPWYYIRKLQMKTKEKVGVGIALGMGLLATVCAIVKIDLTVGFWYETDITYGTVPLLLWSCGELALITIAACIPTLRPFYLWMTGRDPGLGSVKTSGAHLMGDSASSESSKGFQKSRNGSVEPKSSVVSDPNIYTVRSFEIRYQDRELI